MSALPPETHAPSGPRFAWIASRRDDLLWYIGSAGAGWLYALLVLILGSGLERPEYDPIWTLPLGSLQVPVTLTLLVFSSWAFLLDGPHLWATLGRTFLDPDERLERGGILRSSFQWFLVGPATIFFPLLIFCLMAAVHKQGPQWLPALGTPLFYFLFRLWAYYHVVRQHWGFFRLYKLRAGEKDPRVEKADLWFFRIAFYTPLGLFLAAPWYPLPSGGYPDLGLNAPLPGGFTIGGILRPALWLLLLGAAVWYARFQYQEYRKGAPLNGAKLLLLAVTVPLHVATLTNPLLALFAIPLITAGHNLQYHRIVWGYARKKYFGGRGEIVKREKYAAARRVFSRPLTYWAFGLAFTFFLFRSPWTKWLQENLGAFLDKTLIAGTLHFGGLPTQGFFLGEALFASFLIGWSLQHYYLDAYIWRVSRDEKVRENLGIP
ncbi:MAG: hypothetical protein AB1405_08600 [Bdellovibrionota bacterium]